MKRLVIDARESGTSTGRYIDKLVEHLGKLKPPFDVIVLTKSHRIKYLERAAPGFEVQAADYKEFTLAEQLGFMRHIKALRPDLVHFGKDHQPILYHGTVVTTMHDLTTARFRNPNKNPVVFWFKQLVYKQVVRLVSRKSQAIITPTQFVKNDIVHFGGVNPGKVHVTYEAADAFTEAEEPIEVFQDKDFIMFNGRPLPHKNLERLIQAFAELYIKHPRLYLMIAGKENKSHASYMALAKELGVENRVVITGWITDGQLKWAMRRTKAYVYPSLSEGFGLPPLEAMLNGAPVVSSNATCLPEVLGEAVRYFDPLSTQAMVGAIDEVLGDETLRIELIRRGHQQVKKYSWRRMAKQTLAIYEQLLRD